MGENSKMADVKFNLWLLVGGVAACFVGFWTFEPDDTTLVCASRCARGDVFAVALMFFGALFAYTGLKNIYEALLKA